MGRERDRLRGGGCGAGPPCGAVQWGDGDAAAPGRVGLGAAEAAAQPWQPTARCGDIRFPPAPPSDYSTARPAPVNN